MHKRFFFMILISALVAVSLVAEPSYATSDSVVISQLQAGDINSSRLVEIYNNSDVDVDITNWCILRSAAGDSSRTKLGCFTDANPAVHIFLPARSFALLASSQTQLSSDIQIDLTMGSNLNSSGHAYLVDNAGRIIDKVGWGSTAVNPEGFPAEMGPNRIIERIKIEESNILLDTDNNATDFFQSVMRQEYQYGALYEVVDICMNIEGLQEILPDGYMHDETGACIPPPVDVCINLEGVQETVTVGYRLNTVGDCVEDTTILLITELLPNPDGDDVGNEFIEIYNPNDYAMDLAGYVISTGSNYEKSYAFPEGSIVEPGQYIAFYNSTIKFTLLNSESRVKLTRVSDDKIMYETPIYENPASGLAWALIDEIWQYTNRPTPGVKNLLSDDNGGQSSNLEPCAPNQYRNPETNRCKLIESASSTLAPCKPGQERNPETNRCRNIASESSLAPCKPGQYRHPETNRCRSIAGTTTLAPCKPGQYRHPETNRCRNIVTMPDAEYGVEEIEESFGMPMNWILFGGAGTLAIGYGTWEWRRELVKVLRKLPFMTRF